VRLNLFPEAKASWATNKSPRQGCYRWKPTMPNLKRAELAPILPRWRCPGHLGLHFYKEAPERDKKYTQVLQKCIKDPRSTAEMRSGPGASSQILTRSPTKATAPQQKKLAGETGGEVPYTVDFGRDDGASRRSRQREAPREDGAARGRGAETSEAVRPP
jgi:hypothetical protein